MQEGDAFDPDSGLTAHVANIIAVKAGERPDAIALVAHYDSRPEAPGAMDDGIGVAVSLEAGRLLAARPRARHSLIVLLTDAEEVGLMGAVHAVTDGELRARIRAYLNLEASGASGPGILFESGPGNEPLVRAWARSPRPRGSSFAFEIYKRLPNDTDFSVFRRAGIPGLNFASVGDGYAYHTSRDVPDRVSSATLFQMGETAVATVEALDAADLPAVRRDVRFSDLLSRGVLILTDTQALVGLVLACVAALVAWIRMLRSVVAAGAVHAAFTGLWGIVSNAAAAGAMLGAVWLLRDWREVYHPWYAQPWRLLALLVACGIAAPWAVTRLAWLLPQPLRYVRGPASVWAVVLPIWAAAAIASEVYAPAAAHLWMVPLGVAGLLLAVVPVDRGTWLRVASVVVLALVLTLFLRDGLRAVPRPHRGFRAAADRHAPRRLPGAVVGHRGDDCAAGDRHVHRPRARPLAARGRRIAAPRGARGDHGARLLGRRVHDRPAAAAVAALYVDDRIANRVFWEVGSHEPGLDLELPAQEAAAWRPVDRATPRGTSVAVGPAGGAFLFRRTVRRHRRRLRSPGATGRPRMRPTCVEIRAGRLAGHRGPGRRARAAARHRPDARHAGRPRGERPLARDVSRRGRRRHRLSPARAGQHDARARERGGGHRLIAPPGGRGGPPPVAAAGPHGLDHARGLDPAAQRRHAGRGPAGCVTVNGVMITADDVTSP